MQLTQYLRLLVLLQMQLRPTAIAVTTENTLASAYPTCAAPSLA